MVILLQEYIGVVASLHERGCECAIETNGVGLDEDFTDVVRGASEQG